MDAIECCQDAASSGREEADMKQSFEAIYENGVLRPLSKLEEQP